MISSICSHIYNLAKNISEKAQIWVACNKLHTTCTSGISTKTKINLFKTCVESILLYGSKS